MAPASRCRRGLGPQVERMPRPARFCASERNCDSRLPKTSRFCPMRPSHAVIGFHAFEMGADAVSRVSSASDCAQASSGWPPETWSATARNPAHDARTVARSTRRCRIRAILIGLLPVKKPSLDRKPARSLKSNRAGVTWSNRYDATGAIAVRSLTGVHEHRWPERRRPTA